jgi:two-component system chemotaxis response regulator CheY
MTIKILAVDDSTSVRKMVESALRFGGYDVVTASDGAEALEMLEQGISFSASATGNLVKDAFNLVVLDINMPCLDGLSLLKMVRERPEWTDLPILMLTTEGQEADRDRALALGANDYMLKPFKPTLLLERVAALLTDV